MSTRANIIVRDGDEKLYFYRHSDGYPSVTKTSLMEFLGWVKSGRIRNNLQQASGWLIILGHNEYEVSDTPAADESGMEWKVGAYEPTTGIHCDVEYIYEIDLVNKKLRVFDADKHPEFKKWEGK